MAPKGTYETLRQPVQDGLAPQPHELWGEIARLKGKIAEMLDEMRQLEKRVEQGFARVHARG